MSTIATAVCGDDDKDLDSERRRDLEEEVRIRNVNRGRAKVERLKKLEALREEYIRSKNMGRVDLDYTSQLRPEFLFSRGFRAMIERKKKEKVSDKSADDSQLKELRRSHYENPSPLIANATPETNFIGIAETGSGKTAAFVLHMLPCIARLPPNGGDRPYALVLAPTRQRALQIEVEVVKFAYHLGIKVVSIVGRNSMEEQCFEIRRGCDVVISTPPLLFDCLSRRYAVFKQCKYVVVDEVDRMIDMGFLSRVMDVLFAVMPYAIKSENREVDDDKRIYMFTATTPPRFQMLARTFLRNPVVRELNYY